MKKLDQSSDKLAKSIVTQLTLTCNPLEVYKI